MNDHDLEFIFPALEVSPRILRGLIDSTPPERLKARRIPGKWSIHEHACHLASIHPMLTDRLVKFRDEATPEFRPFLPGDTDPDEHLIQENLEEALDRFERDRVTFVAMGRSLSPEVLARRARHPEYEIYTPFHLLRHILMHDHLHMYRIEELAFTTEAFLPKAG